MLSRLISLNTSKGPRLPIRDRLFWLCIAMSLLDGLSLNLLPVAFKIWRQLFAAGYEMQGRTEAFYFIGALVGALVGGTVASRTGVRRAARIGLAVSALGCGTFALARSFLVVQVGCSIVGLGSTWVRVCYTTFVAQFFQTVRQRVFASITLTMAVGATLGPTAMGLYVDHAWLEREWPWWVPFAVLGTAFLLCGALLPFVQEQKVAVANNQFSADIPLCRLVQSAALWFIALATILHALGQVGAVVWLAR